MSHTHTFEKAKRIADENAKLSGADYHVVAGNYAYYIGRYPDAPVVVYTAKAEPTKNNAD